MDLKITTNPYSKTIAAHSLHFVASPPFRDCAPSKKVLDTIPKVQSFPFHNPAAEGRHTPFPNPKLFGLNPL